MSTEFAERVKNLIMLNESTGEDVLDEAIKLSSIIQNIRIDWSGDPNDKLYTTPDGTVYDIRQDEEMVAVLDGRIFPSRRLMDILNSLYMKCKERPIPKTPEVKEYHRYLLEDPSVYSNQMVDKIRGIEPPSDEKKRRCAQLIERQRIGNILEKEGVIDKRKFLKLVDDSTSRKKAG